MSEVQLERMRDYLKYGVEVALAEQQRHDFNVLETWYVVVHPKTGEKLDCGTIGCMLGSYALAKHTPWRTAHGNLIQPRWNATPFSSEVADYFCTERGSEIRNNSIHDLAVFLGISYEDAMHLTGTDVYDEKDVEGHIISIAYTMRGWIKNLEQGREYNVKEVT